MLDKNQLTHLTALFYDIAAAGYGLVEFTVSSGIESPTCTLKINIPPPQAEYNPQLLNEDSVL